MLTPKAVIYARYSSRAQTECSIEGQLADCHAYAEREELSVVHEYIDRAKSGRFDDRPAFLEMIADAAKKQFQYVIVWKLDRFARNRYDSAIYKHKLKQYGVKVLSAMESIGDNPESIILESVLEASAEYFSIDLAKKIKRGIRTAANNGTYIGGIVPFGYTVKDRKLVRDDHDAPYVKQIFEMYASGVPCSQIAEHLNKIGLRTRTGKPWCENSFNHILWNRKYIGEFVYGGHTVKGGCEALVSNELFEQVAQRRKVLCRAPATGNTKDVEYQLLGKAFCGLCGARLGAECGRGKLGTVYHYYTCGAKKKNRALCNKLNEKKDFLEWYVCEQTVEYVLTPKRIEYIAELVVAQYDKEFGSNQIAELEKQLNAIEAELENAIQNSIRTTSAPLRDSFIKRAELLTEQKGEIEIDIAKLRVASRVRFTVPEIVAYMKSICTGDPLDPKFREKLIDTFINSVYV